MRAPGAQTATTLRSPKPTEEIGLFDLIRAAFHEPRTTTYKIVQSFIWALIVVSVLLLVVEPLLSPRALTVVRRIDTFVLTLFGIELALRVLSYQPPALDVFHKLPLGKLRTHVIERLRYMLHPMQIIDLIVVMAVFPALRGLRALRLLRLLRGVKIFRYHHPLMGVAEAFRQNSMLFIAAFSLVGMVTAIGGLSFYLVERGAPGTSIHTIGDGLWWAIVTLTTVGFGDITPVTGVGRIVGAGIMVAGLFTLGTFAGVVGHSLLSSVLSLREEQFRMSGHVNHVIVCGYDHGTPILLETMRHELDLEQVRVVVFARGERPEDVRQPFIWVSGDPTKESQLDKVRVTHAAAVIITGDRSLTPSQSDANVLLTTFTIRSYLRTHADTAKRHKPLYLIAEILDAENVEHARNAGADEVVQTRQLGYSLLAHSVTNPGAADALSNVVLAGATNIYVGQIPDLVAGETFGEVMRRLGLRQRGALVLGYIDVERDREILNPPDETPLPANTHLVYLAERPVLDPP